MKILFIADIFPELSSGSAVRNLHLLTSLSTHHTVDLVGLTDNKQKILLSPKIKNVEYKIIQRVQMSLRKKLLAVISGNIPYVQLRKEIKLPQEIIDKLHTYDVIHLAELNSYFLFEKYLTYTKAMIMLDEHNIEYIRLKAEIQKKSLPYRIIASIIIKGIKKREIAAVTVAHHVLVCSDVDAHYVEPYKNKSLIHVIPNGVDIEYFDKPFLKNSTKKTILFMGLLSYAPNTEALEYYYKNIHKGVVDTFPNIEIEIIGKNAPEWLIELAKIDKNTRLIGYVEDIRKYIYNATVCIAPLLSGSGTRLKILEYMAMKKPIVSTYKGAEGICVTNNENILLAKNVNEFIYGIHQVLTKEELGYRLGKNAYILVKKHYQWKKIGEDLENLYFNQNKNI